MVLFDVSVLLNACTPRSPHHELCRESVEELLSRGEPFGVSDLVLAAVVRLATNPRVFNPPAAPEKAFAFTDALREHPDAVVLASTPRHWAIFRDLVLSTGIRGAIRPMPFWLPSPWRTDASGGRRTPTSSASQVSGGGTC